MVKTFCIGDIHGCLGQLRDLMARCEAEAGGEPCRYVFLGDYIDRGPDSRGVIDVLMELQARRGEDVVCLRGNHEVLALATLEDPSVLRTWLLNGADATLRSYGVGDVHDLPPAHIAWLRALRTRYDDGRRLFVHAGVDPAKPIEAQEDHDMIWIREPFLSAQRDYGRLVVHGHTPTKTGRPECLPNRIGVDTGAVYGGPLTAVIFTDQETAPVGYLQSPAAPA
jgi:Calcineurin-like phosphoesterase